MFLIAIPHHDFGPKITSSVRTTNTNAFSQVEIHIKTKLNKKGKQSNSTAATDKHQLSSFLFNIFFSDRQS